MPRDLLIFTNAAVDIALLGLLLATVVVIMRSENPLTVIIVSALYSLLMCTLFVIMDAVDVAFTEAAVGAGVSTVLLLAAMRADDAPPTAGRARLSLWSLFIGVGMGLLLIAGTVDMPWYGDPTAPIHQYLAPRFLTASGSEIGIPNVVTSVLASYRGYDTLGEVVVIVTAGLAVLILLAPSTKTTDFSSPLGDNPIIMTVLIRLLPVLILFALYVQFHGDYGPGGGFQAGVIFAAAIITYGLLTDVPRLLAVMRLQWLVAGMAGGVLLYCAVGVATLLAGGEFLNYSVLAPTATLGQHIGILLIELGVGISVAATLIAVFVHFHRPDPSAQ